MSVICANCLLPVPREKAERGYVGTVAVFIHPNNTCPDLFEWDGANFEGLSQWRVQNAITAFATRKVRDYLEEREKRVKSFMGSGNAPQVYMYAVNENCAQVWWGAYLAVEYVARPVIGTFVLPEPPTLPFRCTRCGQYFSVNALLSVSESSETRNGVSLVDRYGNAYCSKCEPFKEGVYSGEERPCDRCGFIIFAGESVLFDGEHVLHTSCPPALGLTSEEWEAARKYYSDIVHTGQLPPFVELEAKRRASYDLFKRGYETYAHHLYWLVENYRLAHAKVEKWF